MAHAQKPDFVFRRNGRVHLNQWWRQFSRLLAAEVCGSAVVMLDAPCSEVVWRVMATHSIRQFPLTSPPVRHGVPSHLNWSLVTKMKTRNLRYSLHVVVVSSSCVRVWRKVLVKWKPTANFPLVCVNSMKPQTVIFALKCISLNREVEP